MDEFKMALKQVPRYFSTWVVGVASGAAAYWMQMSPEDQQLLLAMFPSVKVLGPTISFVAFVIARSMPQQPKE